ncbi:MAG: hypothetical protein R2831_01165 [Chitinophagaceae bacterium]
MYPFVYWDIGGYDTGKVLNLTINQSSTTINATACWNYTFNGVTYNSSGTYTYSLLIR